MDIYATGRELGKDMEVSNGMDIGQPMHVGSNPAHGTNFGRVVQRKNASIAADGGSSPSSPTNFDQVPESVRRRVSSDKHGMNVIPVESKTQLETVVSYNHENKDGGSNPSLVTNFT